MNLFKSNEQANKYVDYVLPRASSVAAITSGVGAMSGYYIGEKMALYFYTFGFMGSIVGTSYFSIVHGLHLIRNEDSDVYNHAISGAFNGLLLSIQKPGISRALIGPSLGSIAGASLYFTTIFAYGACRSKWLDYRIYMLKYSKPKVLVRKNSQINRKTTESKLKDEQK